MAKANQLSIIKVDTKDPRVRMKEVRAEVRMYVENGTNPWGIPHIGHLYETQEDMARAMIALHDMYDARAEKHNKASNHVADLLAVQDILSNTVTSLNATIAFLDSAGENLRQHYDQAMEDVKRLKEDRAIQDRKLEAALITISTIMEG